MAEHEHSEEHASSGHGGGGGGHAHGGGGHEEHEGAPEWLISFADNVALMMGFFVILLAMNMKPANGGEKGDPNVKEQAGPTPEVLDMAIAIREAFNSPVDLNSTDSKDQPLIRRIQQRRAQTEDVANRKAMSGREQDVRSIRPSDYIGFGGSVPFEDGASDLTASSGQIVTQITDQLRGRRSIIEVRGHVSTEEAFSQPDRGMQLSYDRAVAVARALAARGIGWQQLRLVASADNDRVNALAYDKAGQRLNQRVEVVATDRELPEYLQDDAKSNPR